MSGAGVAHDPVQDFVEAIATVAGVVLLAAVGAPLVVPVVAWRLLGFVSATRTRYWVARPWLAPAAAAGVAIVAGLFVVECVLGGAWIRQAARGDAAIARL